MIHLMIWRLALQEISTGSTFGGHPDGSSGLTLARQGLYAGLNAGSSVIDKCSYIRKNVQDAFQDHYLRTR